MSAIEPNVLGLRARGVLGDQILLSNLSATPVVIHDPAGRRFIRVPAGKTRTWHDMRVVATGDPPPPTAGAGERDPRLVKHWRIPGRAGARRFEITGFLGWVPPERSADQGVSGWLLAGLALVLVALSAAAAFVLSKRAQ
ncbi:MAG: hypothetical protein ACRDNH_02650 [Gaiellaceae bacterium]